MAGSPGHGCYGHVVAVLGRIEGDISSRAAGSGAGGGGHTVPDIDADADPDVSPGKKTRKKTQRSYSTARVEVRFRHPV